jgi:hypothetical protein
MGRKQGSEPAVMAGGVAGIAGLAAFLLVHQLWIVPIWSIAPVGVVMAGLGGAAVGASFGVLRPHLPPRPWTAPAVVAVIAGVLGPAVLVAQVRGPMFAMDADGGGTLLVPASEALFDVLVGLLAVSTVAGAVLGALVGRSGRAALTTGLAGLALAIGPGHNIPFLGGTVAAGKGMVILAIVVLVSAITLVEVDARLRRARPEPPWIPARSREETYVRH